MVHQLFVCRNKAWIIWICINLEVLLVLCVIKMFADPCHKIFILLTGSIFDDIDIWIVWYQKIMLGILFKRTFTAQAWAANTFTSIVYQKTLIRSSFQRLSHFWWISFNPNGKFLFLLLKLWHKWRSNRIYIGIGNLFTWLNWFSLWLRGKFLYLDQIYFGPHLNIIFVILYSLSKLWLLLILLIVLIRILATLELLFEHKVLILL